MTFPQPHPVPYPVDPGNPWQCQTCGIRYPIRPLARDCEKRHQQTTAQPRRGGPTA